MEDRGFVGTPWKAPASRLPRHLIQRFLRRFQRSGTCASVGCRYVGLHASGWCPGAFVCLYNGRALTCAPAPSCESHSGTLLPVSGVILPTHLSIRVAVVVIRLTVVRIAMGTPPDMAELRLSNKGFQAFSREHPCSRLQAHSLNPVDPYASCHDVHGMLSVSA